MLKDSARYQLFTTNEKDCSPWFYSLILSYLRRHLPALANLPLVVLILIIAMASLKKLWS